MRRKIKAVPVDMRHAELHSRVEGLSLVVNALTESDTRQDERLGVIESALGVVVCPQELTEVQARLNALEGRMPSDQTIDDVYDGLKHLAGEIRDDRMTLDAIFKGIGIDVFRHSDIDLWDTPEHLRVPEVSLAADEGMVVTMNAEQFDATVKELHDSADAIAKAKRPDYTREAVDVLANFKEGASYSGITPLQDWMAHLHKQFSAISRMVKNPDGTFSEPMLSRFADMRNYIDLGYALYAEAQSE